ncbi:MAG: amino acid adenylation domain-containing protein, partial [Alphaproteobacteria bacterium]
PLTYAALLAVSKAGAVQVPLDPAFPPERMAFIMEDAGVSALLSTSALRARVEALDIRTFLLDECAAAIGTESGSRLEAPAADTAAVTASDADKDARTLSYIVYTSGSTGTPKGVAVAHSSIVNFIRVAGEVYGVRSDDRMYQGLTIAFDFSVEEIWIALNAGATLVPAPPGPSLAGTELAGFLREKRITALCCVPTLLATLEDDLPDLRFLLVSGEACPDDLIARWHRKGRRILNAYGPTEATVTATWQELHPGKPVTIGRPLPTYSIVILDPDRDEALEAGETGEIGIAGIGLALGYVNRDDLTRAKFIPDFAGLDNNPSRRIYRTGDLGRINAEGEIEYFGRIDTQVKIRGYRIELSEIESLLLLQPGIAQAVVAPHEEEGGTRELVAYYTRAPGTDPIDAAALAAALRERLPSYMVPAYFEELDEIPLTPASKADRSRLPPPAGRRVATATRPFAAPRTAAEEALAAALAHTLKLEQVSVEDDFFCDLGAHSLIMARFAAEIRARGLSQAVSMRDIYLHPTVRKLGARLDALPAYAAPGAHPSAQESAPAPRRRDYWLCGTFQLLAYCLYSALVVTGFAAGLEWTHGATDATGLYLRATATLVAAFAGLTALPLLLKWLLIGRWRQESFPLWGWRYARFWLVRELVQMNPMALFAGTELYNIYLRLLGANIGRDAVIFARALPVATDLLSVGEGAIVQRESVLPGYHARAGRIHIGPVTIGPGAHVGEGCVLDIDTLVGARAQLGHSSALLPGQRLAEAGRFHGSPAEATQTRFGGVEPLPISRARRLLYPLLLLLASLCLYGPALIIVSFTLYDRTPAAAEVALFPDLLAGSLLLYFGLLALGLVLVVSLPRLLYLFLRPERTYPLFGIHYYLFSLVRAISNAQIYQTIFGDSSWIVHYLKWLGYELNAVKQTGTNFGLSTRHDIPFLCDVGSGTMVSDGLIMINARFSASSFRLARCRIGADTYLGNAILMPPGAHTAADCLLASKVMVPTDGPLREKTGLLGSPAFEIPRASSRDIRLAALSEAQRGELLAKKNAANLKTIAAFLFFRWLYYFLLASAAIPIWKWYGSAGLPVLAPATWAVAVFTLAYLVFVEHVSLGFRPLTPVTCSIYDPRFWRVEHFWKVSSSGLDRLFRGTPFKNLISRLLGIRMGHMVFDDGARATERTLVRVGDQCTLNDGVILQSHSLEEGVYKSDEISVGPGVTLGVGAYIHYGTDIGAQADIAADAFLMKGESPAPGSRWLGNPARAASPAA